MLIRIIMGAILVILLAFTYKNFSHDATVSTLSESHPDFIIGQVSAPHTVIMFFDYNSKWSRRSHPVLMQLIAKRPDVRIVLKDYPGITDFSETITRVAHASRAKNKYQQLHYALMNIDQEIDETILKDIVESLDMDYAELKDIGMSPDIDRVLEENRQAAYFLGINAAPSFVVDGYLLPGGGYTVEDFQSAITEAQRQ